MAAAAVGCAGSMAETRHGTAAGEWRVQLPKNESAIASLAFGKGGNSTRAAVVDDEQPAPLLASAPISKRSRPALHHTTPAVAQRDPQPAMPFVPPEMEPETAPSAAPVHASANEPIMLAQADQAASERYGARQADSRQLETYKGGDAIVITGGALLLVLLVVILVLLLT